MSKPFRRHHLKVKDFKAVLEKLPANLREAISLKLSKKLRIEVCEVNHDLRIYLVEGKPLILEKPSGEVFPSLLYSEALAGLPRIVVDRGAVAAVCRGADVMRPGIVRIEGEFDSGDLVAIVDEAHGKPIALGLSLTSSKLMEEASRGKMVKTIHHVGDKNWNLYRNF